LVYLICFDATCPFPELLWSLPLQQARFPDFRLERIASRPSQSRVEISDVNGSDAIAGTQWREPSGHFTQLPLSPSWAPATVQLDDVELKQRLLSYKEQVLVVDEASLYA
jgi:hypothetical protein